MKAVIHRSITFWSGILVMTFICWAWWDSNRNRTLVYINGWVGGENYKSAVEFYPVTARAGTRWEHLPASSYLIQEDEYLPAPFFCRGSGRRDFHNLLAEQKKHRTLREKALGSMRMQRPDRWMVFIPHWLILLVATGVWIGLLVLRSRRGKGVPFPQPEAVAPAGT